MALINNNTKSFSLFKGIKENPRKSLLNMTIILLLVFVGVWQLKLAFLAQLAFTNSKHVSTVVRSQTDPNVLANLAREEHMGNANLNASLLLYKQALQNFILHVPSWLGLTELYYDKGDEKRAVAALDFANRISQNSEDEAWTKAILADSLDQEEILVSNLLWLAEKHPSKRREIFALADLNWNDPNILLQKFDKTYYLDILDYYMRADELEKTKTVWQQIEQKGLNDKTNALPYINYLLRNNEFDQAVNAWTNTYNKDNTFIYNGNFEEPLTGSAFGWRITKGKGVSSKQAGYSGGLQVSFDGSENITFQLIQTIPLSPGEYEFSSSVETDELTTDQRPFWMITGYQCQGLNVEDEMVPPTQHPETFIIPFTVPPGCKAIQISLRRNKSFMLDNKTTGKITVGRLALTSLSAPTNILVQADQTLSKTSPEPSTIKPEEPVAQTEIEPPTTKTTEQVKKPDTIEQPVIQAESVEEPPSHTAQSVPPEQPPVTEPAPQAISEAGTPQPPATHITGDTASQELKQVPKSDSDPTVQSDAQSEGKQKRRKRARITINKLIIRP